MQLQYHAHARSQSHGQMCSDVAKSKSATPTMTGSSNQPLYSPQEKLRVYRPSNSRNPFPPSMRHLGEVALAWLGPGKLSETDCYWNSGNRCFM